MYLVRTHCCYGFLRLEIRTKEVRNLVCSKHFHSFLILEFGGRERIWKSEGGTCGLRTNNGEN